MVAPRAAARPAGAGARLGAREHYWVSRIVREDPQFATANRRQRGSWDRLRAEIDAWPGTALISHEFLAAASAEQAARMVADLAPAEVHLVVTGREPLGLFTASWQESVKNRDTRPLAEYSLVEAPDSGGIWNWRTLDIGRVLQRWSPAVPAERVHVLPLPPPTAPRHEIWDRFATWSASTRRRSTCSRASPTPRWAWSRPRPCDGSTPTSATSTAPSTGAPTSARSWPTSGWSPATAIPSGPAPERVDEARVRGRDAVAYIAEQGFDVIGDLASLLVPDDLPERRTPETVTDAEVARVAVELVARMLHDVRELRHERRELRSRIRTLTWRTQNPPLRNALIKRFPRLGGVLDPHELLDPPPEWRMGPAK